MSEHLVVKHTKNIFKAWGNRHQSLTHRIGEIFIEILIIVFAVSLSLFFERWRERQHDRETEKQFLLGLRTDLHHDVVQERSDSVSYWNQYLSFKALLETALANRSVSPDSIQGDLNYLSNTTILIPNDSRFEALKSSGELGVIENPVLRDSILNLYQYSIRATLLSTGEFTDLKLNHLTPFIITHIRVNADGSNNLNELIRLPEMQNFLRMGETPMHISERYHDMIMLSLNIIAMIDAKYKGER
jgi:hypothetical protein